MTRLDRIGVAGRERNKGNQEGGGDLRHTRNRLSDVWSFVEEQEEDHGRAASDTHVYSYWYGEAVFL